MEQRSSLYRLVDKQLDGTLREYVTQRRPGKSWRAIATELSTLIGVEVSYEALRGWFPDSVEEPVDAA